MSDQKPPAISFYSVALNSSQSPNTNSSMSVNNPASHEDPRPVDTDPDYIEEDSGDQIRVFSDTRSEFSALFNEEENENT